VVDRVTAGATILAGCACAPAAGCRSWRAAILGLGASLALAAVAPRRAGAGLRRPNVILIETDDENFSELRPG
jgi:hypothetical protein